MGEVLRPDGSERFDVTGEGAPADAERLGRAAGRDLAARLPEARWSEVREAATPNPSKQNQAIPNKKA